MKRIQRQRTKGYRLPPDAVYVGRPSRWGNPFDARSAMRWGFADSLPEARRVAVQAFRSWINGSDDWWTGEDSTIARSLLLDALPRLRGRDLACWCPLEDETGNRVPCHADVLLALANPGWTP